MKKYYTNEKNAQIVVALLKSHGIGKVIASPGGTNIALVASMQHDQSFEMYSAVDERSAAYMACGLAAECGEPVVISCTGATASRNYLPGLTEAFYRKLPILAITSTLAVSKIGHHIAQVVDRSSRPNDVEKLSVTLPIVKDDEDVWDCEMKVNKAILELRRHGGGPVHINLPTTYSRAYDIRELPNYRVIHRITENDDWPELPRGKVAVFVGAHGMWSKECTEALERFCEANDAVVICDHTSNYRGAHRVLMALVSGQEAFEHAGIRPDVLIHIGEITGDYYGIRVGGQQVWRVSEDGEVRDTFGKLRFVFEMSERSFFRHYSRRTTASTGAYLHVCKEQIEERRRKIPELPFSNIWIAKEIAHQIPDRAVVHFGILNSLRSWNFFELPESVSSASNVGGFGIDGALSSLLGASLADRSRIYFGVVGDLAFFYDINALGSRHIGNNLRILLINNGKGTEFRQYSHSGAQFEEEADKFISAAGHFGSKSPVLVKHFAEDLGFEYLAASTKDEFGSVYKRFLLPTMTERPMLLEVFTDSAAESEALETIRNMDVDGRRTAKQVARQLLGDKTARLLKRFVNS